jgi:cytochrome c553
MTLQIAILAAIFPVSAYAEETSAATATRTNVSAKIEYCKKCHGLQGQGFSGAYTVPRIAGQTVPYIKHKFKVISEHMRDNPTAEKLMVPVLRSVDTTIWDGVAKYFNSLNPNPVGGAPTDLNDQGKKIYEQGVPKRKVPTCVSCHGPEAKGKDVTPRLAGQLYPYTVKVLTHWTVINKELATEAVQAPVEHDLTTDEIAAVAAYLSDLK